MNLTDAIETSKVRHIHAGGPGSGRHKGFADANHMNAGHHLKQAVGFAKKAGASQALTQAAKLHNFLSRGNQATEDHISKLKDLHEKISDRADNASAKMSGHLDNLSNSLHNAINHLSKSIKPSTRVGD